MGLIRRPVAVLLAALVLAIAPACGPAPRTPFILGGITVQVSGSPAHLRFLAPDGTVLLDGLPVGKVKDGASPEVAAAFATGHADYQMLYGSFKITNQTGAWHGVTNLTNVRMDGKVLRFDLAGTSGGTGSIAATADGVLTLTLTDPGMTRSSVGFRCHPDEHFMGFGAQSFDVDHRGFTVPVWVSEQGIYKSTTDQYPPEWFIEGTRHSTYFPVPFFVSSRNFGILADTTRRSLFHMCSDDKGAIRIEVWEGTIKLHLFFGKSPLDVLAKHTGLVGRAPIPPDFAFAPWNDAVFGSANVRRVADELRASHIPSSMIWTEDWGGGHDSGQTAYSLDQNWTIDRTLYPDAEKVATDLHGMGFKWMAYFNTFVAKGDDHYDAAVKGGYLIKDQSGAPYLFQGVTFRPTSMVDLTNPKARAWMATYMNACLDLGFDGWMADYGEWLPTDAVLDGGSGLEIHNRYPVMWQKLNDSVFSGRTDGVARLDFVRSGYTGSQGIAHQVVWGGDQSTDFDPTDGLPTVIPIGVGLGAAGMPYFGSDIAGYYSGANGPSTKELFFRWAPVGAFSPIMRTHHGREARANWAFDTDAETLALWKRYAILHTRLFPYFEAQARLASTTGAPMMRGLGLDYPADSKAWPVTDEYLLGPDLLVAPVVHKGKTARKVYLPNDTWIPLSGGTPVVGPATETVQVPLGEIPVYAKAGTVLVLLPPGAVDTLTKTGTGVTHLSDVGFDRTVWAYLGAEGSFTGRRGDTYAMKPASSSGNGASFTWNGTALSACDPTVPKAPCYAVDTAKRTAVAYVKGDGTLAADTGSGSAVTFTTSKSSATRALTVHLFW